MKNFIARLSFLSLSAIILISGLTAMLFGTSVLENVHRAYIRTKATAVVKLYEPTKGGGTGFFIKGKSGRMYILTNNHICRINSMGPLSVEYYGGVKIVKPIKSYATNDLCIVEAPSDVKHGLSTARSVSAGEIVYAIGHPLLEPLTVTSGEFAGTVTLRMAEQVNGTKEECIGEGYKYVEIDNPILRMFGMFSVCERSLDASSSTINILPGNSGSPVVNIYGNVVGVVFAAVESGVHSYIVPLSDVKKFLEAN